MVCSNNSLFLSCQMGLSDGAFFMIKHTLHILPNGNHPISSPICPMGVADTLGHFTPHLGEINFGTTFFHEIFLQGFALLQKSLFMKIEMLHTSWKSASRCVLCTCKLDQRWLNFFDSKEKSKFVYKLAQQYFWPQNICQSIKLCICLSFTVNTWTKTLSQFILHKKKISALIHQH